MTYRDDRPGLMRRLAELRAEEVAFEARLTPHHATVTIAEHPADQTWVAIAIAVAIVLVGGAILGRT